MMLPQGTLPDPGLIKVIWDFAPALGAAVAVIVILLGALGRFFGISAIGDKSKLVDDAKITAVTDGVASITVKLGEIDKRITRLEYEIESRPTRAEIHAIDLGMTKLDGRMGAFESEIKAVRHIVNRIDDFLLAISERSIRDGGR